MLNDIMLVVVWILGMALMAGITSEDESVGRFFAVIFWPLAIMLVLIQWGWDEFKYRMLQRRKRKSQ
jgi:hypothetical protein|nr:MAG TPA: Phosphoinositide-interacting protein family [Caudoviricetes sp.]